MPDDYERDDYLTPRQVAELWGVTPQAVRIAIKQGRLKAIIVGPPGSRVPRYLIHKRDTRGGSDTSQT
jgi:hypothetical protein